MGDDADSEVGVVDDASRGGIWVWAWKKRRRVMPAVLDGVAEEAAAAG